MEAEIIKNLGLGGVAVACAYLLYKEMVRKNHTPLTKDASYKIQRLIVVSTLILIIIAILAWVVISIYDVNKIAFASSSSRVEASKNVCLSDEQTLCIEGFGLPMQKFKPNSPAGNASAQDAAALDADNKFLKRISGHEVNSSEAAKDYSMKEKSITSWSKDRVRSGEIIQIKRNADGSCNVIVRYKKK